MTEGSAGIRGDRDSGLFAAFRAFLGDVLPIPDDEWAACEGWLTTDRFETGRSILEPGRVCERVVFLVAGLARTSVSDMEGRESIWDLHFAGHGATLKNRFLLDFASLVTGDASPFRIEAVTSVEAVTIHKAAVDRLYATRPFWSDMGRRIAETAYCHTQQRTLALLCLSARERYQRLIQEAPGVLDVAPQHMIASYLGITPQSLSRIRRELGVITKCE